MTENIQDKNVRNEIDFQINKYTLKCLKTMLIAVLIMWLLNFLHIFIVNMKLMTKGIGIAAGILVVAIMVGKVIDLHKAWVKYVLIAFTILASTVLGVTLTYHTLLLSIIPLLIATQYTQKKILAYTYVLTTISTFVIVMGGYFWGLCDANMLLLTTETTSFYRNMVGTGVSFQNINTNPWYTLPLYFVIPRCVMLALALPVIQSISKNIKKQEEYAVTMKHLSERDEMTGLFNRNKFLSMIQEEYPKMDKVCVIFFDVNNLKQINDTFGHGKGDDLITGVGGMIMTLTNRNTKAYRFGGDEFVIVVENPEEGEVDSLLQKWEELLLFKSKAAKIDLSVAVGYSYGEGKEIERIIKEADQMMYQRKKEQKSIYKKKRS